jgi:hypothetical protein
VDVIEKQVEIKVLAAHFEVILTSHESETLSQLQEKVTEMFKQPFL